MRGFTLLLLTGIAGAVSLFYWCSGGEPRGPATASPVDLCETFSELSNVPPLMVLTAPGPAPSRTGTGGMDDAGGSRFDFASEPVDDSPDTPIDKEAIEAVTVSRLPIALGSQELLSAARDGQVRDDLRSDDQPNAVEDADEEVFAWDTGKRETGEHLAAPPIEHSGAPPSPAAAEVLPTVPSIGVEDHSLLQAMEEAWERGQRPVDIVSTDVTSTARLHPESATHLGQLTNYAISLAERGALCSARSQLIENLRLIAQRLDAQTNQRLHSRALAQGLRTLEEANDFAYRGSEFEADLQVADFVVGHDTPVLKQAAAMTPLEALTAYQVFARKSLALAGGREPVASHALYALGRVEQRYRDESVRKRKESSLAIPLFEAAILVDPQNLLATNELALALAGEGQLRKAAITLEYAVRVSPRTETLTNLAEVYRRLGDQPKLLAARRQLAQIQTGAAARNPALPKVDYVPPRQFAQLAGKHAAAVRLPTGPTREPRIATVPPTPARSNSTTDRQADPIGINFW